MRKGFTNLVGLSVIYDQPLEDEESKEILCENESSQVAKTRIDFT